MEVCDHPLEVFLRRKRIRQPVVRIENARVLNPGNWIDLTSCGNVIEIKYRTCDARAMSLRSRIVCHIVRVDAGQEATTCGEVNGGRKPTVAFLDAAVDHADRGSTGRGRMHSESRLILPQGACRYVLLQFRRQYHIEQMCEIQNNVPEASAIHTHSELNAVGKNHTGFFFLAGR